MLVGYGWPTAIALGAIVSVVTRWLLLGPGLLVVLVLSAAPLLGVTGDNRVDPPNDGERVADGYDARSDETTIRDKDPELSAAAALVVTETNEARAKAGLGELTQDRALTLVAAAHTGDMIERAFFSHTSPDGDGPLERVEAGNPDPACRAVGENLGQVIWNDEFRANYGSEHVETEEELAQSLVAQWLYSESHRETLLDKDFDRVGVALGIDGNRVYATQKLCR